MPILYDGIGANDSGIHSEAEFQDIMIRLFIEKDWNDPNPIIQTWLQIIREENPDRNLPQEFPLFTLDDWVQFSGAIRI